MAILGRSQLSSPFKMSMQTRISDNFCLQLLKKKSKSLGGDKFYEKVHLVLIGADSVMVFRVAQTKPATLALQEEDFGVLILKLEL